MPDPRGESSASEATSQATSQAANEAAASGLKPRGSSQGGLRQDNERLVLQALRLHGALHGAEIARQTQRTAQTVSMIAKRPEADGLLLRGAPQRGRVGQPSVRLSRYPDGAHAIGIQVGRRSVDVLRVDFAGTVRQRWPLDCPYADPTRPGPAQLLAEIGARLSGIRQLLAPAQHDRRQGVGIAAPLNLGGWQTLLDMPAEVAARWPTTDLRAVLAKPTDLAVMLLKDTAAACVARLVAGRGRSRRCGRHTPEPGCTLPQRPSRWPSTVRPACWACTACSWTAGSAVRCKPRRTARRTATAGRT